MDPEWREIYRYLLPYIAVGIISTWLMCGLLVEKNKVAAGVLFLFQGIALFVSPIIVVIYKVKCIMDNASLYGYGYLRKYPDIRKELIKEYGQIKQIKVKGLLPERVCKIYALVSEDMNNVIYVRINREISCCQKHNGSEHVFTDEWGNIYEFENNTLVMRHMVTPKEFIGAAPALPDEEE